MALAVSWINRFLFSTWIPSSASIGTNFKVGYWGLGVVIHSDAVIGNNCLISQNVTIGRKSKDRRVPVIGDNVYVGAGAVIIGEIKIGDNSVIGANSFVNSDVPRNATAVGVPARVLERNL